MAGYHCSNCAAHARVPQATVTIDSQPQLSDVAETMDTPPDDYGATTKHDDAADTSRKSSPR